MPSSLDILLGPHRLTLLSERAVWWPAQSALLVADTHFGKASHFRSRGLAVPEGSTEADLRLLSRLIARHESRSIVILGDLLHGQGSLDDSTRLSLKGWRDRHASIDITLVRGNHDHHAGDPPGELGFQCVDEPCELAGLKLFHHPRHTEHASIAGHVHPAVRVEDFSSSVAIPCFVLEGKQLVMPAFGRFTGCAIIEPAPGRRIFPVAAGRVVERQIETRLSLRKTS